MLDETVERPGQEIGVVVIGRNEGERLVRCLASIDAQDVSIVYVDSGSTDGSVATARGFGADVVELDMATPFCAARARNAGYQRLLESHPRISSVQFIDGDCEIVGNWLHFATESLIDRPDHAVVTGRLREKSPERSIYNRLGDLEWNFVGAGEVNSVGGIFMVRREAFDSVCGFDSTIAAGEEPELCQRLIAKGWRLVRLDRDMALHDLAMTRFGQWWRRMMRNGYGSTDVASRFGVTKFARMNLRARVWAVWLALIVVMGGVATVSADPRGPLLVVALLLGIWPIRLLRIAVRTWRMGHAMGTAAAYAFFMAISFLPEIAGQMLYLFDRIRSRSFRLVEYKAPLVSDGDRRN